MAATKITLNAWTGQHGQRPVTGELGSGFLRWGLARGGRKLRKDLKPPEEADPKNWRDSRVGWGLVLADGPDLSAEARASGSDAPQPIRELVEQRSAAMGAPVPILRYRAGAEAGGLRLLRNYRAERDLSIPGSGVGLEGHQIPQYLLIYGSPDVIPWELQYILSAQRYVGRLDLGEDEGLGHYVRHLIDGWPAATADVRRAVVWAVHHGSDDITSTLRSLIARKVHLELDGDSDITSTFVDGKNAHADAQSLIDALAAAQPGVVVSTSHGMTGPLDDPEAMARDLGLLVDQDFRTLDPDQLLENWAPDGAIWLAHACCSAGSVAESAYDGLFDAGNEIGKVLRAVADLGNLVSPLPRRLLGHSKPVRAFIGQVEPTFDWTLRDPAAGQRLTSALCEAIYPELYRQKPVGLALSDWHDQVDGYDRIWTRLVRRFNEGEDLGEELIFPRLAARDVESTVILGDPTVALPEL